MPGHSLPFRNASSPCSPIRFWNIKAQCAMDFEQEILSDHHANPGKLLQEKGLQLKRGKVADLLSLGGQLGKGSYGTVRVCQDVCTGGVFACKTMNCATLSSEFRCLCLEREVSAMALVAGRHQGTVQLKDLIHDDSSIHIVMDLCRGGDLLELLLSRGPLPEAAARYVLRQVAEALGFCHTLGIMHRDIKPENILFDLPPDSLHEMTSPHMLRPSTPVRAKIADFGLSLILSPGERSSERVGSLRYCAPEVYQGVPYDTQSDMWSLGVVLYAMLSGTFPFADSAHKERSRHWSTTTPQVVFSVQKWTGVSEEAKDLVWMLLQVDPRSRPNAFEVLQHPWLQVDETGFVEED